MAEELKINLGNKEECYRALIPQVRGLLEGESDFIANMSNMVAALKEQFGFFWVGFYRVFQDELILGPFQGSVACTRISRGKGVCGSAWQQEKTLIVPDVMLFDGHIACSPLSRSEIVVPLIRAKKVIAVLDVDSQYLNHFDHIDQQYLEQMVNLIPFDLP